MKRKRKGVLYIQCPACKTEVPAGSDKCSRCGEPVDLPLPKAAEKKRKSSKVIMWVSIIGTAALIILAVYLVLSVLRAFFLWSPV